jgi:hypothetical protein
MRKRKRMPPGGFSSSIGRTKGILTMNKYIRTTLSGLLLAAMLAGSYRAISPGNVDAESVDSKIPVEVRGRQFTIDFGNGERLNSVTVADVIWIHSEPWWRVALPPAASGSPKVAYVMVNPRQIRMLEGLP